MFSFLSLIRNQYRDSLRSLRQTRTLTTVGILLAMQMVLASYGMIEISDSLRITLDHLALAPTAMLFGPVAAGIQGGLKDILAYLIRPSGAYFPGFTLSAILCGLLYGMLFYKTQRRLWQIVTARALVVIFINILLNTVFLTMLYGPSRLATLPLRAAKSLMQLPIDCLLLTAVLKTMQRVPILSGAR